MVLSLFRYMNPLYWIVIYREHKKNGGETITEKLDTIDKKKRFEWLGNWLDKNFFTPKLKEGLKDWYENKPKVAKLTTILFILMLFTTIIFPFLVKTVYFGLVIVVAFFYLIIIAFVFVMSFFPNVYQYFKNDLDHPMALIPSSGYGSISGRKTLPGTQVARQDYPLSRSGWRGALCGLLPMRSSLPG